MYAGCSNPVLTLFTCQVQRYESTCTSLICLVLSQNSEQSAIVIVLTGKPDRTTDLCELFGQLHRWSGSDIEIQNIKTCPLELSFGALDLSSRGRRFESRIGNKFTSMHYWLEKVEYNSVQLVLIDKVQESYLSSKLTAMVNTV